MKPRITLAILAYNQSRLIEEAVSSGLAQICEPIEILLSDDASSDSTFARMQAQAEAYSGPHHVVLRRNPRNLGIGEHFNIVLREAHGELLVLMAGDDISLPTRVALTAAAWDGSGGRVDLIACPLIDMSHQGVDLGILEVDDLAHWKSLDDWVRRRPRVIGAGHAITRRLFERFGPLPPRAAHEEEINTFRALCSGGAMTLRQPLVRYRRGGVSQQMRTFTGANYLAWVQRQNSDQLAQHAQWLADAKVAGVYDVVAAATRREHDREQFVRDLLAAPDRPSRLRVTLDAHRVELGWRMRKLLYFQLPELAANIRRLQAQVKRLRHGEQR
ncbi:MAG: glycosyltransferase family A protein [Burkholderiaceae bacterium]